MPHGGRTNRVHSCRDEIVFQLRRFPDDGLQVGREAFRPAKEVFHPDIQRGLKRSIHRMGCKLLRSSIRDVFWYAEFETCFGWDSQHHRCLDLIAKHISTSDVAPF